MKLHYKGKYDRNPESLPSKPHQEGAIAFKEATDTKSMMVIGNVIATVLLISLGIVLYLRCGNAIFNALFWGGLLAILCLFPHEFLHAICFKEDVYLYTNLKQGMMFVVGPETMSKGRYIFLSLLPNLIFGFIPFLLALIWPSFSILGVFGLMSISMGAGDYYNVFNAITQMPKGSRTYLHKFNSYWYMP